MRNIQSLLQKIAGNSTMGEPCCSDTKLLTDFHGNVAIILADGSGI